MAAKNFSELRPITLTITGTPINLDGYRAIIAKAQELENQYENSLDEDGVSSGLTNLTAAKAVLTSNNPYKVYIFDLTTVFATGTYTFDFVEEAANTETATSL